MKCRFMVVTAAVAVLSLACTSRAYEHKLQFTPYIPYNPVWGNSLVVIGEQFTLDANNQMNGVTGLIHFVTVPSRTFAVADVFRLFCPDFHS